MRLDVESRDGITLLALMLAYCAASLLHFVHNAVYLHEYPNLPASLTSAGVYAAWCGMTVVGAIGYWLYRRVSPLAGLLTMVVYSALGFAGLDHYIVAPLASHSAMMNLSIGMEASAAAALLFFVIRSLVMLREPRARIAPR